VKGRGERSRPPLGTVAVAMAAAVVLVAGVGGGLGGERAALAHGQFWRLWTAHVVHFSASHALWSGLVWLVAGAWMEREDRRGWLWMVLAGAPLVTMAALAGDAEMVRYGGLSGLACAPLVWAAWRLWRDGDRARRATGAAVFSLLALKVITEMTGGGVALARFGESVGEVRPAPWAHFGGMLFGAGLAVRSGGRRDRSCGELACRARDAPVGSAHE
jgi:rhomboid family GlyGly-CTERM serine protease